MGLDACVHRKQDIRTPSKQRRPRSDYQMPGARRSLTSPCAEPRKWLCAGPGVLGPHPDQGQRGGREDTEELLLESPHCTAPPPQLLWESREGPTLAGSCFHGALFRKPAVHPGGRIGPRRTELDPVVGLPGHPAPAPLGARLQGMGLCWQCLFWGQVCKSASYGPNVAHLRFCLARPPGRPEKGPRRQGPVQEAAKARLHCGHLPDPGSPRSPGQAGLSAVSSPPSVQPWGQQ